MAPETGEVIEAGNVGEDSPLIENACSISPIMALSFSDTTPHRVKASEEFSIGINLRLAGNYHLTARELLRDTFISWANTFSEQPDYAKYYIANLDFAIATATNGNLAVFSKKLNLGKLAEHGLFSEGGYSLNIVEYAPGKLGSYLLLARLRREGEEGNSISRNSDSTVASPLEILANPALFAKSGSSAKGLSLLGSHGASPPVNLPAKSNSLPTSSKIPATPPPAKQKITLSADYLARFKLKKH